MKFNNIKTKLAVGLIVVTGLVAKGETVIIEESSVKTFNVNSNEAIVFTGGYLGNSFDSLTITGRQCNLKIGYWHYNEDAGLIYRPYILSGPLSFTLFTGAYNIRYLTNHTFKTEIVIPFVTTNIITVNSNQTIRFFTSYVQRYCEKITLTSGTNSIILLPEIHEGFEFDGPVTFAFNYPCDWTNYCPNTNNPSCLESNWLASVDCQALTYSIFDRDCESGTNGLATLSIEKSSNLVDWSNKGRFIVQANEPYEFYRLKLSPIDTCNNGQFMFGGGSYSSSQGEWENTPNLPPVPWSP